MSGLVPPCPRCLFALDDAALVEDADEEVFEIYMMLAGAATASDSGGLGYLDAKTSTLELELTLEPPVPAREAYVKRGTKVGRFKPIHISIRVQQDLSALKGRKGDTGSVLWRSSLHLARHVLTEHHFPPPNPLLNPEVLQSCRVLELGAGTGILAALLSPLCASYTASDRLENLALVRRNLDLNSARVDLAEIDWESPPHSPDPYDLILAVDCIYNESLVKPLVDTFNRYSSSSTLVWVVVELRSSDVLTLFLSDWLGSGWTVVRLGPDAMGHWEDGQRGRWVGWVGWRSGPTQGDA